MQAKLLVFKRFIVIFLGVWGAAPCSPIALDLEPLERESIFFLIK